MVVRVCLLPSTLSVWRSCSPLLLCLQPRLEDSRPSLLNSVPKSAFSIVNRFHDEPHTKATVRVVSILPSCVCLYIPLTHRAIAQLEEEGTNPYPHKFHVTISIPEFVSKFKDVEVGEKQVGGVVL